MTTNRMGLTPEMALEISNERIDDETLAELIDFRRSSLDYHIKQGYKTQAFMHGVVLSALRELLAYRKASKQPVAYADPIALQGFSNFREHPGSDANIRGREWMWASKDSGLLPLYAAPPQQAVTVPDEMTPEMMRAVQLNSELGAYAASNLCGAYDLFAEFWKVACRAATLKSVTNEP